MALHPVVLTAICAIVLAKIAQRLCKRFQFAAIIDKIPGPKAYPLVGNALNLLRAGREEMEGQKPKNSNRRRITRPDMAHPSFINFLRKVDSRDNHLKPPRLWIVENISKFNKITLCFFSMTNFYPLHLPQSINYLVLRGLYDYVRAINVEYKGGIFRTWIGMKASIHLNTAETISTIMPSRSLIVKSEAYDFLHPWLGTGLLTATGEKWHRQRKLITPAFHFNILEEFAPIMTEKAEILKQCITSELENNPNNPIKVFELMTRCALDIICGNFLPESAMGININAQTDPDAEYSVALDSITSQTVERILRPWLHADWIFFRTSRGKKFKRTVAIAHKFTNQVISERKLARKIQQQDPDQDIYTDKPKRQAFLDHLLDACERDSMPLTNDELREEVDTFLFAGHDTTASAMSYALFCIGNNPGIEEKIHQEQLRVFRDSTEPATLNQLAELKYLDRVIKETLRLFPSAPTVSRTLTENIEIAGYKVPKDVIAVMEIHQVHRDPKYWPEPEKFDPDRFLWENSHGRHPYAYVPFSAGPRSCIGQKYALLEQKIVLTAVLRTWKVKSLLKYHEAKCYTEFTLRPQDRIKIYFTRK